MVLNQREEAWNRGLNSLGQTSYSFPFNNCEHFVNYVQYGKHHNTRSVAWSAGTAGMGMMMKSDNPFLMAIGGASTIKEIINIPTKK